MRRTPTGAFGSVLAWVLVLSACDKAGPSTTEPEPDTGRLERLEGATGRGDAPSSATAEKVAPESKQALPKVRDRDPEVEKRKMAQSRVKSSQALKQLRAGSLEQAILQSRAALKIHEQNVEAMLVIAEAFFRQSKYELTLAVTNSVLAVDPKVRTPQETGRANLLRGFAHAAMGNDYAATEAFKKAAESDDKSAAAWNNLGTRYLDAGDAKTAVSCFLYAIELEPRFAKAHLNLGAAYRAQRNWADAESSLQKALTLRRNYPEAYFNLGLLYLDADPFPGLQTKDRLQKAISYLEKYKSMPAPPDAASVAEGSVRTTKARGRAGAKPGPPPVSPERADDYIRVAQKGLDRETRRIERETQRAGQPQSPGGAAAEGGPSAEPTSADERSPTAEAPASRPAAPQQPAPSQPAAPQQPAPSKPAAPQQPAPSKPAAPQQPAPSKPAPQQPGAQQPGVQRPGQKSAAAGNPRVFSDTKLSGPVRASWIERAGPSVVAPEAHRGTASLAVATRLVAPRDTP